MKRGESVTRVDDAYERLKAEILKNRLPPGFQATEPEVALRLGMSRTPVREALIRLQSEGLIELIPRRGVRVLPISPTDMQEIYWLLTALEPDAAAALASKGLTAEQIASLEEATSAMEKALEEKDLDLWAVADDRFHRELLYCTGNGRLLSFVTTLFDQAHRVRMITLRLRDLPTKSTAEHRAILKALRAGDAELTRRLFRAHRERAAKELLAVLERGRLSSL
ncbi:GntR family transcriptional regulator [Algihabitans albus]|uniref:GntR family transcriptional regulator n=1 Tax=Algihabitans albus TaxID=2164067 RepID=UPI000E5CE329|nr:GntR family transcriptional regulator [Algihabitans albus]